MTNGTIKFFNQGKGFGFIAGEDGKEYFVHTTGLKDGTNPQDLQENVAVTFDVVQGDRGPKAENVCLSE
ncbi:MAG: cold shock domain-containing protein [Candidatus Woesearchaeota archaeon]